MRYRFLLLLFLATLTHLQMNAQKTQAGRYAAVNGLNMYYEVHGSGMPLVLIHGGGSTIQTTFGVILPELAKKYQVIAVELQAHGHTADIDRPLSFEQDADDVAALLKALKISRANFMGFSNGGTTTLQIAIRHPEIVNKIILASALYKRDGMPASFFDMMQKATLKDMPMPLQHAYKEINPDPKGLQAMFDRDVARMRTFKDISDTAIQSINAPALVINGFSEAISAEHALALTRALQHAELVILPGGHGEYIGEIMYAADKENTLPMMVTAMIERFLKG